jgi:translation initiation factor eIF-2B subunit gamma
MEFNAVIFCGDGHNLVPLTSPGESRIPKALLPIANKPLIEYVLEWCDQAPFKSVNLITDLKNEKLISEIIKKFENNRDIELRNSSPIKIFTSELNNTGSILNEIFPVNDIKYQDENYVILPCDFITDVPPQVFIEVYRGNSDENIGLSIFYNNTFETIDKKVLKSNYTVYSDQDNGNMVLLDMYSKDFVKIDKFLKIRTQMLWRYPSTKVSTKLLDSFIFFMDSKCRKSEDIEFNKSINKIKRDLARNSWKHSISKSTIGLFALPKNALFARVNNLAVYMEMNRHFLKEHARNGGNKNNNNSNNNNSSTKGSANIGVDCLVSNSSELGERTTVKRSVIGENVKIGKKCRISASVILDGVTLEDDVQLENCIIGKNVKIESKSKLVNCNVEGAYTVGRNVSLKGETLKNISLDEMSDSGIFYDTEEEETEEEDDGQDESEYDDEGFEEEEYEEDIFAR